jgi:hypothetical protein
MMPSYGVYFRSYFNYSELPGGYYANILELLFGFFQRVR